MKIAVKIPGLAVASGIESAFPFWDIGPKFGIWREDGRAFHDFTTCNNAVTADIGLIY